MTERIRKNTRGFTASVFALFFKCTLNLRKSTTESARSNGSDVACVCELEPCTEFLGFSDRDSLIGPNNSAWFRGVLEAQCTPSFGKNTAPIKACQMKSDMQMQGTI